MNMSLAGFRICAAAVMVMVFPLITWADDGIDFEENIWPLLHERCHTCHGEKVREGGLRLDIKEMGSATTTDSPIVPGKSNASELIRRITSDDPEETMPPQGQRLSSAEVRQLAGWIDAGAPWPDSVGQKRAIDHRQHWAWGPRDPAQIPTPKQLAGLNNPIDSFIQNRLETESRSLSAPADKRTLLRRLTFDLIGLPPTPEEVSAFLADESPDAFETVVDRLLSSPRYGERWGRHWMDLVRYADTAGDNADYPVPEARLYRDYIIDAFNEGKPYDQFVREQLAGDILAASGPDDKYAEQVIATGYIALSRRYATAPFELMHLTIEDAIDTTGRTFLGLTLRCARCHDHKFDPITMEDYYGLYGIFGSTRFPYAGSEEFQSKQLPRTGFVSLIPPNQSAKLLAEHDAKIAELKAEVERRQKEWESAKENPEAKKRIESELKPVKAELTRLVRLGSPPGLDVAYAVSEAAAADQPIQQRGEPSEPGPVAPRRAPRFFAGDAPLSISGNGSGRLEFARWLTQPDNPLTAKVMVNRIWQHHFGQGLVRTSSNFGILGEAPTHPELLDWLARQFVENGWSIKEMHRLMLSSSTWHQASSPSGAFDPLVGQQPRRRLDAESVRDSIMFTAQSLDLRQPDPHPFPDIRDWQWSQHKPFKEVYPSSHRSVFLMRQRIQRHPFLVLFDAPDANVSTDVRTTATVPQQALYLMNDPFIREQSAAAAKRIMNHCVDDPGRIDYAIELIWSRPAQSSEVESALGYLDRFTAEAKRVGLSGDDARLEAWASYARVLLTSNAFFYVD